MRDMTLLRLRAMSDGMMTMKEYAEHRGISVQAVMHGLRKFKVPLTNEYPVRVDSHVADVLWANTAKRLPNRGNLADRNAREHPTAVQPLTAGDVRLRKELAQAELAEQKLAVERGQLVRADAVASDRHKSLRTIRDRVLSVPARVSADIAALGDATAVRMVLDAELRVALTGAADDIAAMAAEV